MATIRAVDRALDELDPGTPVVLDPVMVAESGAVLLDPDARAALIELLLPRCTVLTPNLPEARALVDAGGDLDGPELARPIHALGPANVVITGGHRELAADVFFDGERIVELAGERYPGGAAHGSGCTHSSVLAARLAWGDDPLEAARIAKQRRRRRRPRRPAGDRRRQRTRRRARDPAGVRRGPSGSTRGRARDHTSPL